jgi:nitroreductase
MTLNKTAVTAAPILPVLAERWSPRSFDKTHEIAQHELLSVLEAARWAPSANNLQPWRFSVLTRGTELHTKVSQHLSGFNQAWAPSASALIVVSVISKNPEGEPYKIGLYDAGLAVSDLVVQAQELGLHVHQMAGFDHSAVHATLGLAENLETVVIVAIGKVAPADQLTGPAYEREVAPRTRLTLDEIVLHGKP